MVVTDNMELTMPSANTNRRCSVCQATGHTKPRCPNYQYQQAEIKLLQYRSIPPMIVTMTHPSASETELETHTYTNPVLCFDQEGEPSHIHSLDATGAITRWSRTSNGWKQTRRRSSPQSTIISNIYIYANLCDYHNHWSRLSYEDSIGDSDTFYWFNCYTGENYCQTGRSEYRWLRG